MNKHRMHINKMGNLWHKFDLTVFQFDVRVNWYYAVVVIVVVIVCDVDLCEHISPIIIVHKRVCVSPSRAQMPTSKYTESKRLLCLSM